MVGDNAVYFMKHAIDRFVERSSVLTPPPVLKNPEKEALALLLSAEEDCSIKSKHRIYRLISNNFENVIYLRNANLRFVLKPRNNSFAVLTVEIIYKNR